MPPYFIGAGICRISPLKIIVFPFKFKLILTNRKTGLNCFPQSE